MHVEAGRSLYTLADTSTMWIKAQFSPGDAVRLKPGQRVDVTIGSGQPLSGKVLFSSPSLSDLSRTTGVQIEVPNVEGRLKAGMTATVEATLDPLSGLVVPADAVIDSGRRQTVFVRVGEGRFEPRTVELGLRVNDRIIVTSGIAENEQIVAGATFLLDSESQLQAALASYGDAHPRDSGALSHDVSPSIEFSIDPDPPRVGTNRLRVHLADAKGAPIADASLSVRFYMAPMPSMNMPAMRAEAAMKHSAAGEYQGTGALPMAGAWEVVIAASRAGHTVAERRTSLVVH
jgi:Cu(I)/Ag(I) efflux system membrane fusion protein/cobalt-zinc-cadmium efflux system membrane fusion protein